MEAAEVRTVVRIPVDALALEVAQAHSIKHPLTRATVESGFVVLEFGMRAGPGDDSTIPLPQPAVEAGREATTLPSDVEAGPGRQITPRPGERKRRRGRRNRMRTKGWNVVTKMTNSHGQTVTVYEPFVKALDGLHGARRKKERLVSEILRSNGNRPGRESVRYYLENTLEYLANRRPE